MRRAVLKFTDIEYRYQDRYGMMPDYDFDRLVQQGYSFQEAGRIRNERIHEIWEEMKFEHEHPDECFRPLGKSDHCPF